MLQETVSSENSFKNEDPNGKIWIELSHQETISHKVNVTEEDERERSQNIKQLESQAMEYLNS